MTGETFSDNSECEKSSHAQHLCYMISQGFNLSDETEYQALVKDPAFKCEKCGRLAKSPTNLCKPAALSFNKKYSCEEMRNQVLKFNSVDELLDAAIVRENQAQELYTKMAFMVRNSWMCKVLQDFALQEHQHMTKLKAVKAGKISLERIQVGEPGFDDIFEDVKPSENMDYPELLAFAIKKENSSYKLYTLMASMVSVPDLKDMFLKLAQEEASHRQRLEIEYDQVTS